MSDKTILRDLIKQTLEIAAQDIQDTRREMWADFNSLKKRHVPVYILDPQGVWREIFDQKDLQCQDPLFRRYENWLRLKLYHASFGDDFVTEPWITVYPDLEAAPNWHSWGLELDVARISDTMAMHFPDPPIKTMADLEKLIPPIPVPAKKQVSFERIQDAVGDLIPVLPDYMPNDPHGTGLSYTLAYMLGPEEMMYQLYDQPDMVHALCKLISDTYMQICKLAEEQGWYTNINSTFMNNAEIQAMTYSREIPSPGPMRQVTMKEHWIYDRAQEFEPIGPEMFDEFLIEYMKPVCEQFAFTAYGCCENLTHKIKSLKRINNLRRVAVTPWADAEACAMQLEDKYIVSYRPHPVDMVGVGWDPVKVRDFIREMKKMFDRYGCFWEVNLKDFLTVEKDKDRLAKWVEAVRAGLE